MQYLSKIVSFVLAAHLLVATSSPPLVYHFCGGSVESIAIGSAKQCCCNEDATTSADCCAHGCCHNELHVSEFHPDGLLSTPIVAPQVLTAVLNVIFPFSPSFQASSTFLTCITTFDTHPPAHSSDIPVLFRTLLI